MQIFIGLGNPGQEYKLTRHNAGFMAVNALAFERGLTWQTNKKLKAEIAKSQDMILVKPLDFINNSGAVAKQVLSYYKLLPKKFGFLTAPASDLTQILTVIHDDLDIDLGQFKISLDSRSAGHKGVQSIINYLKTKNFKRIRLGIRTRALEKIPAEKFVLQNFSQQELDIIRQAISQVIKVW